MKKSLLAAICASFVADIFSRVGAQKIVPFVNCAAGGGQLGISELSYTRSPESSSITVTATGQTLTTISGGVARASASVMGTKVFSDVKEVCSVFGGCPISPGSITGTQTFSIPANIGGVWGVDVAGKLEWFDETGQMIGCVDSQFALEEEGTVTETIVDSVVYSTALGASAVAIGASGVIWYASVQSTSVPVGSFGGGSGLSPAGQAYAPSIIPSFVDFATFLQFLSETGMLALDYPTFYRDISSKFGWSNFIPDIDFLKDVTRSFFLGNSLATENVPKSSDRTGIAGMAAAIGLKPSEIFAYTTVVLFITIFAWVVLCLVVRVFLELFYVLYAAYTGVSRKFDKPAIPLWINRSTYFYFCIGNVLRIFYLGYFALVTTSVYQFTRRGDPWALYLWAGIVLAVFCVMLSLVLTAYLLRFRSDPAALYADEKKYVTFGAFYNHYAEYAYSFFVIFLAYRLTSGIAVGGAYFSPLVQMAMLLTLELAYLLMLLIKRPLRTRFGNKLHVAASLIRVVAAGLLIAFIPELNVSFSTRSIIGIVVLALNGLALLCYTFVLFKNLISSLRKSKPLTDYEMEMRENAAHDLLPKSAPSGNQISRGKRYGTANTALSSAFLNISISDQLTDEQYKSIVAPESRRLSTASTIASKKSSDSEMDMTDQ